MTSVYSQEYRFKQTAGPSGGLTYVIDSYKDTLITGGKSGLWLSADWGETWEKRGLSSTKIASITINDNRWIVGGYRDKIMISKNSGSSWERYTEGLPFWFNISGIIEKNNVLILASDCCGIYRSLDQGETWEASNYGITNFDFIDINSGDSTIIAIALGASGDHVFLSSDFGNSWIQPETDLSLRKTVTFQDCIYGFMWRGSGIKISGDDGYSWQAIDNTNFPGAAEIDINQFGYFISSTDVLYRSTDHGITWQSITPSFGSRFFQNIETLKDRIFISSYQGIYSSADGGDTWMDINPGRVATEVTSIIEFDGSLFAGTFGGGVHRSTDKGETWVPTNTGLTHLDVNHLVKFKNKLYATTGGYYDYLGEKGILYVNSDGNSWQKLHPNLSIYSRPFCSTSNSTYMFYGNIWGLFRSSNGSSWQELATGQWTKNTKAVASIGSAIVMGTGGSPSRYYRSSDNGSSWNEIEGLNILHISNITAIDSIFYAGSDDMSLVYRSVDLGQSWERVNCPAWNFCEISSFEKTGDTLYVGLNSGGYGFFESEGHGLLISPDNGETWSHAIDSTLTMNVNSLEWFNGELFVGTEGGGVIKYSSKKEIEEDPDPEEDPEAHLKFVLHNSYPNPTTNITTFKYQLPNFGRVVFQIFDINGRIVHILDEGQKNKGDHTVLWNAQTVSSGVYFYRLTYDGKSVVRKCVVIK